MTPAKAAPMREDVTLLPCPFCGGRAVTTQTHAAGSWIHSVECILCGAGVMSADQDGSFAAWNTRLAHTARPDAGDDKAEIERLRGLLIDPGTPPWEDARAVLATEMRKIGRPSMADHIAEGGAADVPSHIALNLIAQAARRPDAGDEDVERVARAIANADLVPPDDSDEYWNHLARAALAAMREGVDRGMVEPLDWFAKQHNLELAYYSPMFGDDDDQSEEWRVTRRHGGYNDREWTVIATGQTAREAIANAAISGRERGALS